MAELRDIERSIIKKYRKYVWAPFVAAVKEYKLAQTGDIIAVKIDNFAQSYLMAKCLQEIKKHSQADIDLVFFAFENDDTQVVIENCKILNLDLKLISGDCPYLAATELKANALSIATVFERMSESVLFNLLERGRFFIEKPISLVNGIKTIRPMYFVREKGIAFWTKYAALKGLSETADGELTENDRKNMRALIDRLNENYHLSEFNIVKSLDNINLDTAIDYFDGEKIVKFNRRYKREKQ